MKKAFMSVFAFSGLALSAFALASCGDAKEVEIKDLNGETYKISQTEDAQSVSKAMVLAVNQVVSSKTDKIYAIGLDASINGDITASSYGITGSVKSNNTISAGVSIGTKTYRDWTEEGVGDYDYNQELKDNLSFYLSASSNSHCTSMTIDKYDDSFKNFTEEELESANKVISALNGKDLTANYRMYSNGGYIYGEMDAEIPQDFANVFTQVGNELEAINHTYVKAPYDFGDSAIQVFQVLNDYQTKSITEFYDTYGTLITGSMGVSFPSLKFDENYFESKDYQTLVDMVSAIGVKVSNVSNGNVTFEVNVTEKEVVDFVKKLDDSDALLIAKAIFSGEKSLLDASITINVENGRLISFKLSSGALDIVPQMINVLVNVIIGGAFNKDKSVEEILANMSPIPFELSGSISFEVNFKYNGDVKVAENPKSDKTYQDVEPIGDIFKS
jgi:hypothetical protein